MTSLAIKENLKKYSRVEDCPIRNVLSHFSGKWSLLILCVLSENDSTRFNEISKAIPDISSKVLSDTLKGLVAHRLISRTIYSEIPPRVEYSLTPLGQSLMPIVSELINWAVDNYSSIIPETPRLM